MNLRWDLRPAFSRPTSRSNKLSLSGQRSLDRLLRWSALRTSSSIVFLAMSCINSWLHIGSTITLMRVLMRGSESSFKYLLIRNLPTLQIPPNNNRTKRLRRIALYHATLWTRENQNAHNKLKNMDPNLTEQYLRIDLRRLLNTEGGTIPSIF